MTTRTLLAPAVVLALLTVGAVPTPSAPAPAESPAVAKLAEARLKAAREAYTRFAKLQDQDAGTTAYPENVYVWSKRLLEAEREAATGKRGVATAFQAHRDRMVDLEEYTKKHADKVSEKVGYQFGTLARLAAVAFYRAEAELWLEQNKAK